MQKINELNLYLRNPEEIKKQIEFWKDNDFFGYKRYDLIEHLDKDFAEEYIKSEEFANWAPSEYTIESIVRKMADYMEFAWDKAINERGLSASRSIEHYIAWLWLIGDTDAVEFAQDESNYPMYGKPILRYIAERYGFENYE